MVSTARAEFLNTVPLSRRFAGMSMMDPRFADCPALTPLVTAMLEAGEVAWDVPEFEDVLKGIFSEWILDGKFIRATLTAQWLLTTHPYSDTQQRLEAIAAGEFWKILDDYNLRCSIVGTEKNFLYPLKLERIIYARKYWAAYRAGTCALLRMPKRSA